MLEFRLFQVFLAASGPPFLDDDRGEDVLNENPIPGHAKKPEGEVKADDYRAEVYAPDRILEEALEFLDGNKDQPFLLYLPFVEPHLAMQPPQSWVDQYPEEWDKKFHVGGVDAPFFNSSANLRGWKGSLYEGGIRVPTIVRWPGKVAPGTVTDAPSYFPDWFPTLCTIAGAKAPEALDGTDLNPVLAGNGDFVRTKPMVWEFHGYGLQLAVIDGPWKAIRQGMAKKKPGKWELYNLEKDPSETKNLAKKYPEILTRLAKISATDRSPNPRAKFPIYDKKK